MRTIRPTTSPIAKRTGFTAAELSIGMIITTLVASAAAALTLAVSQGWTHTERVSMAQVSISRACQNVEQTLRGARMIGRYRAGTLTDANATPAGVLVWRADVNGDGQVQFEEIAAIEFDGPGRRLVLYKPEFPSAAAKAAGNTTLADPAALSDPGAIEDFKASPYVVAAGLTRPGEVAGACFNVVAANNKGSRPSFEFTLQFTVGGQTTMHYGTATLRSPMP